MIQLESIIIKNIYLNLIKAMKHFIEITLKDNLFIRMTLKDWARDNQHEFPKFGFTNNTWDIPTTHKIRDLLISKYNYQIKTINNTVTLYR